MKEPLQRSAVQSRVKALRALRPIADERVEKRCDIVGSTIGVKISCGVRRRQLCLTYLVREKIPTKDLSPRDRIPGYVLIGADRVPTDVMVWPRMKLQTLRDGLFIRNGRSQSTLTAFAQSPDELWGLSCGHCLLGEDGKPFTHTQISMRDRDSRLFVPAGETGIVLFANGGRRIAGSTGFLDCG